MTIRSKLALGLFANLLILLAPLAFALHSLEQLHTSTRALRDHAFGASLLVGRMRAIADELRQSEERILFVRDTAGLVYVNGLLARLHATNDSLQGYDLEKARSRVDAQVENLRRIVPAEFAASPIPVRADSISTRQFLPAEREIELALRDAELVLAGRTTSLVNAATTLVDDTTEIAGIGLAIAASVALLVSIALWRTVSKPVRDLESGMEAVAAGQFDYRLSVSPTRNDEFGRLATSYKTMASQLAQLDRLKAEFVSVASHELKTPINVVLGYLQLLNEGVYGPISPKQGEILRTIDAQTRSLSRLVHQLLDISRFEAGGGKLDLRAQDLGQFLSELEDTFHVLSLQRGINFRIVRAGPLPAEVVWDPDRINEVLGNLLSNAFKFTKKDGTVELNVEAEGGQISLTVRDTGAGIPPEQLPHIFRKFFQADNQHSASQDGTGLGLAIAKQIVDAHGGKVTVDSAVGQGTTFNITLPVRTGPRPRRRSAITAAVADASA
jgi:signal transduction histidine kinase